MALVKCKECNKEVSGSAKTCPNCGVKYPKKTSVVTWIVASFLAIGIYGAIRTPSANSSASPSGSTSSGGVAAAVTAPIAPQWEERVAVDKMTGKRKAYTTSPTVSPTDPMESPYRDVHAWMGVGCDGKDEWVYVAFSTAPNLTDTETKSGYSEIQARIKWDDKLENVALTQEWGAKVLHFDDTKRTISKITTSNAALLELKWYGQNHPYFSFPMDGAAASVAAMRKQCAGFSI